MNIEEKKKILETLYLKYNRREFVHPDPLEFLYEYESLEDREIVGLIASSLAYGRVAQILNSVRKILGVMESPSKYVKKGSRARFIKDFRGFKHRFTTGEDIAALLTGIKKSMDHHGSLENCFSSGVSAEDKTVVPALKRFVSELRRLGGDGVERLIPCPCDGSACKRLHLFLRWMIRRDDVDPGGWREISPDKLVVPLDTHMHKICMKMDFTNRKQADLKTALEATKAFRVYAPKDPVRYDFSLTRLGILRLSTFSDQLMAD